MLEIRCVETLLLYYISSVVFALAVLLFTFIDWIVHSELYRYGLQYSDSWAYKYWVAYGLAYQLVIMMLYLYNGSWQFALVAEAFVLSCTQDFIYFGLWEKGKFPVGDWDWMLGYKIFGRWKTSDQIITSITFITTAVDIIILDLLIKAPVYRMA